MKAHSESALVAGVVLLAAYGAWILALLLLLAGCATVRAEDCLYGSNVRPAFIMLTYAGGVMTPIVIPEEITCKS